MHISLDQAIGRQPRLNRVGQSLLNIASGASAAYSLRSLTGDDPRVVRVRRSSDNAEQDFTVSDLGSGALAAYVGNYQTELSVARNYTTDPYESFTNVSSSGFTASNASGTAFAGFDLSGAAGDEVEVSFELTIRSGSPQIRLRTAYDSSSSASSGTTYTTSGTKTVTLTATSNFGFISFSEADIPSDFDVSNFQIVSRSEEGYVETWYDQSGNGNDVTAAQDEQPKIVESGTLLAGAKFDGTDDFLKATDVTENTGPALSMFTVSVRTASSAVASLNSATLGNVFMVSRDDGSSGQIAIRNTTNQVLGDPVSGNDRLNFLVTTGNTSYKVGVNGTAVSEGTVSYGDDFEAGDLNTVVIGARRPNNPFDFYDGLVKEVIVYNSDQSSNRTAIETNINGHYSIF